MQARFGELRHYCMFVGTPRSGHSLIGGLLDAHPDAVIAHEAGALRYLTARFGRERLFRILLDNARARAGEGRTSGEYSYRVPGQWQGRHRELRVIGDKQAEGATLRLRARPWLLDRVRDTVALPIRVLHVVRNPFDNIATMARRAAAGDVAEADLTEATDRYFALSDTVAEIRSRLGADEWIELRHEAFLTRPKDGLRALCERLELEADEAYLEACAGIVYDSPHRSRDGAPWTGRTLDAITDRMAGHPHLSGYRFDA